MEKHELVRQVSKSLTDQGLINLGKLLERSRLALKDEKSGRSFGLRKLSALIKERTGVSVSKDTLQNLEMGRIRYPRPDTVLAIAAAKYVLDPQGKPYSLEDLLKIAAEEIDPGDPQQEMEAPLNVQDTAIRAHDDDD